MVTKVIIKLGMDRNVYTKALDLLCKVDQYLDPGDFGNFSVQRRSKRIRQSIWALVD